jgi:hypothetical protein
MLKVQKQEDRAVLQFKQFKLNGQNSNDMIRIHRSYKQQARVTVLSLTLIQRAIKKLRPGEMRLGPSRPLPPGSKCGWRRTVRAQRLQRVLL